MSRATKAANLEIGEGILEILVAQDYKIVQMSPFHFRINGRLDVWPSTKRWYDLKTMRKGYFENLQKFVKETLPHAA